MRILSTFITGMTALVIGSVTPVTATNSADKTVDIHRTMRRMAPKAAKFNHANALNVAKVNADITAKWANSLGINYGSIEPEIIYDPASSFGPNEGLYDMDGPNGELWYYTIDLSSKPIEHEYYTEYILQEYVVEIYNSRMEPVGRIHDKMRYLADEVRVPGPINGFDVLPVITKHYFNQDDKYEIAVCLAVNTTTEGRNRYRTVVYTVDGEKETQTVWRRGGETEITVDKPIMTLQGFIVDVLDGSTPEREQYYMAFEGMGGYNICSSVDENGNLPRVLTISIPSGCDQGDQESSAPLFSLVHKGETYICAPIYEKSFFLPTADMNTEPEVRANNNLLVRMWKISGNVAEQVSNFKVPVVSNANGTNILCTFYSVGDLRYRGDVLFDDNDNPMFIVHTADYNAASDSSSNHCYYIYDNKGKKKVTIFENAEANMALTSIEGQPEQHIFVLYDEVWDERIYYIVDILKGRNASSPEIPANRGENGDVDMMLFNVDRVPVGDSYKYVFEMRMPLEDDNGNTLMRAAWFNHKGSFDREDRINMGSNVDYAQLWVSGLALRPELVITDDAHEYMILIKRSTDTSAKQEELLIAQPISDIAPEGNTILHLTPHPAKGTLSSINLNPGAEADSWGLLIYYMGAQGITADWYPLPFDLSSMVELTPGDNSGAIKHDGDTLHGAATITLFDMNGRKVATGTTLDLSSLSKGVYVAVSGSTVRKIAVK